MLGHGAIGQFAIGQAAAPETITVDKWFQPLSEPRVKTLRGARPSQQQFIAFQPSPSPFVATGWFMPLSEPSRKLRGLDAARQQFLAAPSRLLPTPTVFGTLAAVETKDTFLGGGRAWNRITSGEIGITASTFTGAQIGVNIPKIVRAKVAITIL